MKKKITQDWQDWIKINIERGCDLNEMEQILLKEGFRHEDIKKYLTNPIKVKTKKGFIDPLPMTKKDSIFKRLKLLYKRYKLVRNQLLEEANLELDTINLPVEESFKIQTNKAEIYSIENFLNHEESEEVMRLIKTRLRPSTIASNHEDDDQSYRTSKTCDLGNLDNKLLKDIDRRICNFLGIDQKFSEVIQGQFYEVGEEFKAHTDFFEEDQMQEFGGDRGQRTYTFMVYLNDVEEGGQTEFLNLKNTFSPKEGSAIAWNNLTKDGQVNPNTMHQAHPVIKGNKAVITKWFREKNGNEIFSSGNVIKKKSFTKEGFTKTKFNKSLFTEITTFYSENRNQDEKEQIDGNFVYIPQSKKEASKLIELPIDLKEKIHSMLKGPLEEWSGISLEPTFVYGIRIYQNGAVLVPHRDREETHIISAIINIDQEVNEDWPLVIEDHFYRKYEVNLKPGEVLYYESAKLLHGRPIPLNGKSFANIFCHFMPTKNL
jgi:prolyl 4-hydroxylase